MTKVLVVEDDPFNMELVFDILVSEGFNVVGAVDGLEALEKIENDSYDLIIMDIELPTINGIELTKKIKSKLQYESVPVIALTAYAMRGDKERFLNIGFSEYISKPIDLHEFRKSIEKYKK